MPNISELMEEVGFQPDTSEVDTLMGEQHYGASLLIGYQMMGEYDE